MVDIIPLNFSDMASPSHDVLDGDGEKLFSVRSGKAGETDTWLPHEHKEMGILAGFWSCTESDNNINYKEWEYFHFLKGEAIITNQDGQSWTVDEKSAVIVPKGFKGRWQTTKEILKKFVIIAPDKPLAENYDPNKIIIVGEGSPDMPEAIMESIPPEKLISGTMGTKTWDFYHDDNIVTIDCGLWGCEVGKKNSFHEGYWEFCNILRGAVTLTNEAGTTWNFKAGDGFIVPIDFKGTWHTTEDLLKEYVIVEPRG